MPPERNHGDALLTTGQAARCSGISRHTLLRAVRRGDLAPALRTPGGAHRFRAADVAAYARRLAGAAEAPVPDRKRGGAGALVTALRDGDGEAAAILGALHDGVVLQDADGRIGACTARAREILGLTADQMAEGSGLDPWWAARPVGAGGTARPGVEPAPLVALRTGQPCAAPPVRIQRPDGSRVWVAMHATPLTHPGATTPYAVVTTLTDITARQEAEEALRASEERYRQVEQHAPIGLALLAPDGRWLHVNPALCRLVGYTTDELRTRTFQDLTHPDDLNADLDQVRRLLAGAIDSYQLEKRYIRKDGSLMWALLAVSLVRDAAGTPRYFISQIQDIDVRKRQEERLADQATHDALTGLPNRALFGDRLERALAAAPRLGGPVALLLLDLDRFKEVNDTLGHEAGDTLLRAVGARLCRALRASDTVARLGGDEFAAVLPGADAAGAERTARAACAALATPLVLDGCPVEVRASVGIALAPEHGADASTLLRHADVAMYLAKRGALGHALYAPALDPHCPARLTRTAELRRAIAHDALTLRYQPIVDLSSGRPLAVEALVRWEHPEEGLIPPDAFIPLAEQTALIGPLTAWVLGAALHQAAAWAASGLTLRVGVNLSARALHDAGLPGLIARALRRHGLAADRLTLEITESTLMADPGRAATVLARLRALGVRVAIDDFGTGYSSLALLHRLPVDTLKIDKSFVQPLPGGDGERAIVTCIAGLGRALGLDVVAEGVETPAMRAAVAAAGCGEAQGYLFARPLPAAEVEGWARVREGVEA